MKPIEQPVDALGAGQQLQHQHLAEQRGVLGDGAGGGLAGLAYAYRGADARQEGGQHPAQQGEHDA